VTVRLAVDTVTDSGSVALEVDGTVVSERVFADRRHAALLLPALLEVLEEHSRQLSDVDEIIVADGPGSFTGIRIGFATIAGISSVLPVAVYVAPSMKASSVAPEIQTGGSMAVLYEALRGEVYAAVYSRDHRAIRTELLPQVTRIDKLRESVHGLAEVLLVGGAVQHAVACAEWTGKPPREVRPHARNLMTLRNLECGVSRVENTTSFSPTYGRLAEAQVRWEREHGRSLSDPSG